MGNPRYTSEVDLIVRDVPEAHGFLVEHRYSHYVPESVAVVDPERQVRIDLLPAGRCLRSVCEVPFPSPRKAAILEPLGLEMLISLKLDSWKLAQARRLLDKADVTELIIRNDLPRDLKVHPAVTQEYLELWDAIAAEPLGPVA